MARLTFTARARQQLAELPRDATLLRAVWRHLEEAANDPDRFTEPAPFPHRPDRLLRAFRAFTTAGDEYAFSALFARVGDEMRVTQCAFSRAETYPDDPSGET